MWRRTEPARPARQKVTPRRLGRGAWAAGRESACSTALGSCAISVAGRRERTLPIPHSQRQVGHSQRLGGTAVLRCTPVSERAFWARRQWAGLRRPPGLYIGLWLRERRRGGLGGRGGESAKRALDLISAREMAFGRGLPALISTAGFLGLEVSTETTVAVPTAHLWSPVS